MKKNTKNLFILLANLGIIALCFGLVMSYLCHDVLTIHDYFFPYEYVQGGSLFSTGRFVSRFIVALYYVFLPKLLHIHPNDLSNTLVPFCNAAIITIISVFFIKLYYLFSKTTKFILFRTSFVFLFPAIFVMVLAMPLESFTSMFTFSGLDETVTFYDHIFNLIFYIIFWYFAIKIFVGKYTNIKKEAIVLIMLTAFLLGISYEMLCYASTASMIILLIYSAKEYFKEKTIENRNILIYLGIFFASLLLGSIFQFSASNYGQGKVLGYNIYLQEQIPIIHSIFIPFLKTLYKVVLVENIVPILFITLLCTLIIKYCPDKKLNKKIVTIAIALIAGVFLFFATTIIGGNVNEYFYSFWTEHTPFKFLYFKILCAIILFLYGYLISSCKFLKENETAIYIIQTFAILSVYVSFLTIHSRNFFNQYIGNIHSSGELRKKLYKADKMAMLYNRLDGTIILPISYYKKYSKDKLLMRPTCYDADYQIRSAMQDLVAKEYQREKSRIFSFDIDRGSIANSNDYLAYLYNTYGIIPENLIFIKDNKALQEYKKHGGRFELDEMKKLKFTNIYRNDKKEIDEDEIERLVEEKEVNHWTYATEARLFADIEDYNKAIEYYTKAIKINPNYDTYYFQRATAYKKSQDYHKALKDYDIVLNDSPYSFSVYREAAGVATKIKDYRKALDYYEKMISIFPYYNERKETTYYNDTAKLKLLLKDYQGAINDIDKAEKIVPTTAAYHVRAEAKMKLSKHKDAIGDYSKTLEFKSFDNINRIYCSRGIAYYKDKNYSAAINDFITYIDSFQNSEAKERVRKYYNKMKSNSAVNQNELGPLTEKLL